MDAAFPKMREVFETFLTDPVRINEEVYALWLQGLNAPDALAQRLLSAQHDHLPAIGDAATMRELLWRDTVDQYRLFEKLEHYLLQPSLFRSQLLFQLPPLQQYFMIERYYAIDGAVARWLLGKKLSTTKIQKDLDEISDATQRTLKSCRRQLENLRRVYAAMEDRNFQGIMAAQIREAFSLSEKMATKYACVMFLLHGRFEVHPTHRPTQALTWHDLLFVTAAMMVHWIPQKKPSPLLQRRTTDVASSLKDESSSPVENGADICLRAVDTCEWPSLALLQERLVATSVRATIGVELGTAMTNCLRDLKAHLINDAEALATLCHHVLTQLGEAGETESYQKLADKLHLVVHALLTIGAGLSQPKELKDLLGNLGIMVVRVLRDCGVQESAQRDSLFSALIEYVL
jgi:hypothetical protein